MENIQKRFLLITTGDTIASAAVRNPFSLDSANIEPEKWKQIAECVYQKRSGYNGIIIAHGAEEN